MDTKKDELKVIELSKYFDEVEDWAYNYWSRACKFHADEFDKKFKNYGCISDICNADSICDAEECWNEAEYIIDFDLNLCVYHGEKWEGEPPD